MDELAALRALPPRIANRIDTSGDCWVWCGWHNDHGYGYAWWEGRDQPVHRIVMRAAGAVIDGLDVDHLCRNTGCCRPAHLEPVTHRENLLRANRTCRRGHDLTDAANVYTRRDTGRRMCKPCMAERGRKRYLHDA